MTDTISKNDSQDLWELVLAKLSKKLSKPSYDTWIARLTGQILDGQILIITAPNEFAGDWIKERYKKDFHKVLKELTDQDFKIKVISLGRDENYGKIRMDEKQAMGYMMLACKEIGLSTEMVKQLR